MTLGGCLFLELLLLVGYLRVITAGSQGNVSHQFISRCHALACGADTTNMVQGQGSRQLPAKIRKLGLLLILLVLLLQDKLHPAVIAIRHMPGTCQGILLALLVSSVCVGGGELLQLSTHVGTGGSW